MIRSRFVGVRRTLQGDALGESIYARIVDGGSIPPTSTSTVLQVQQNQRKPWNFKHSRVFFFVSFMRINAVFVPLKT